MDEYLGTWMPYFLVALVLGATTAIAFRVSRKRFASLGYAELTLGVVLSLGTIVLIERTSGPTATGDRAVLTIATFSGLIVGAAMGVCLVFYARLLWSGLRPDRSQTDWPSM